MAMIANTFEAVQKDIFAKMGARVSGCVAEIALPDTAMTIVDSICLSDAVNLNTLLMSATLATSEGTALKTSTCMSGSKQTRSPGGVDRNLAVTYVFKVKHCGNSMPS